MLELMSNIVASSVVATLLLRKVALGLLLLESSMEITVSQVVLVDTYLIIKVEVVSDLGNIS